MSEANKKQIGGDHYRINYQHWDFICDANLHYLIGCATKYVYRWRTKGGIQDLEKALHYIEKAIERNIIVDIDGGKADVPTIQRFTRQLEADNACIVLLICLGQYTKAIEQINELINENK